MGDPSGPWQQEGGDHRPHGGTPRHLPSTHRAAAGYDLGYGAHAPPVQPGYTAADYVETTYTPADDVEPGDDAPGYGDGPYGDAYDDGPYGDAYDDGPYDDAYDDGPHGDPYDDGPYGDAYGAGPHGDAYDDGPYGDAYDDDRRAGGVVASLQDAAADAAWRYRSAPLWARVTADLAAAGLVLALIVGVSLALRQDGGPQGAAADSAPTTTSTTTTSTTVATTTTTVPSTTTTAPTTTTVPPTSTTTAPPVVPPPTDPPTTAAPTTTTTEPVSYRDCREAMFAGALPLYEGEPGYSPRLDRDHDGEACEWDDWGN